MTCQCEAFTCKASCSKSHRSFGTRWTSSNALNSKHTQTFTSTLPREMPKPDRGMQFRENHHTFGMGSHPSTGVRKMRMKGVILRLCCSVPYHTLDRETHERTSHQQVHRLQLFDSDPSTVDHCRLHSVLFSVILSNVKKLLTISNTKVLHVSTPHNIQERAVPGWIDHFISPNLTSSLPPFIPEKSSQPLTSIL